MEFKPVTLDEYDHYMEYYRKCMIACAETSFMTVWLEGVAFDVVQAFDSDFFWHKMTWEGENVWLPPVGDWDGPQDWQALLTRVVPKDTTFVFVPAYLLRKWQAFAQHIEVEDMRSEWDYIYSIERQVKASGKSYRNWRASINRFADRYPDWSYEPITVDIIDEIKAFQAEWMEENSGTEKMTDELRGENKTTLFMLDHWAQVPNAVGAVLRVSGRIAAFIVLEKLDENIISGQFLKADYRCDGAARFLKNEMYKRLLPNYVMINAWGDSDMEGLRQNKLKENPITLYRKYKVRWKG